MNKNFIKLFTGFFLCFGLAQSLAQDYYYYYFQDQIPLSEINGKYAIQLTETIPDAQKLSFLESLGLKILGPIRNAMGYTLVQATGAQNNILDTLKASSLVTDAMPLFKLSDGIECMVSNRFIVKYKPYMRFS